MAQVIRFIVSISLVLTFSSVALSQVPVPSPGQADAPVGRGGNYILAPNDIVLVKVFQEPDLDSQHRISQNGTINFPLIGLVKVGGKTVEGAADAIKGMLAPRYLKHPEVRVNVLEYGQRRFTVLGQVQKPGSYFIPGEQSVNLMEAIAMAGGFTRLADTGKVIVRRNRAGQDQVFRLKATPESGEGTTFKVQPDDTITVNERMF